MSAMTDYLENKLVDFIFRAQSFTAISRIDYALYTAAPGETGGGTEVTGGNYARVQRTTALTAFKGTHGNTTGASSGTGGVTTNANQETFGAPSANWGTVTHMGLFLYDGTSNLGFYSALTQQKTVNNGDPAPYIAVDGLSVTFA